MGRREPDPGAGRAAHLAAVREVLEETGTNPVVQGLTAVSSGPEAVRYENGDLAQYVTSRLLPGRPELAVRTLSAIVG